MGHLPLGCQGHVPDLLSCSSLPRPPEKAQLSLLRGVGGQQEGVKCPGDVLGSLVTGLLSCSPAEVVRALGNKVNNPNIVEEDKYSISHLPEAVEKAPVTQCPDFPPSDQSCSWSPPELLLSELRLLRPLACWQRPHSCPWLGRQPLLSPLSPDGRGSGRQRVL